MNGFEILKKLGNGSFSSVYKVRRKQDNNIYALKKVKLLKLREKEKQAALNEVRILASIKSPFIISYKEAFIEESDKSLCIIMEYADDGDLYQKICQYKKMNLFMEESDIWRVFIQMVKGLRKSVTAMCQKFFAGIWVWDTPKPVHHIMQVPKCGITSLMIKKVIYGVWELLLMKC